MLQLAFQHPVDHNPLSFELMGFNREPENPQRIFNVAQTCIKMSYILFASQCFKRDCQIFQPKPRKFLLPNAPLRNVVSSTNNHAVALGSVTSFSLQNTTSQSILRSSFNADTRQQLFSARAGVNDKAELLPSTLNYYWYHPVSSLASMCDFRSFSVHQQFQMDVTYCNHN